MKFNLILLAIFGLIVNFVIYANGYFISETLGAQIKTKLSNILGPKPNRIIGIISAPEFGISHEETVITDDDNQINDDKYTDENFNHNTKSEFNIFETHDFDLPIIGQRPMENENRSRPRLGNLRGNNKFEERTLRMRNYIGDEDIIEYNDYNEYAIYFGPESNPNIKSSTEIELETNIQSE